MSQSDNTPSDPFAKYFPPKEADDPFAKYFPAAEAPRRSVFDVVRAPTPPKRRSIFDVVRTDGTNPKWFETGTPVQQRKWYEVDPDGKQGVAPSTLSKIKRAIPEPVKNTVGMVLDLLGRPGAATAGLVAGAASDAPAVEGNALARAWDNLRGERRDDFDQVLEEQGVEDGLARNMAGFVGDLALDPLNLVGVGAVRGAVAKGMGAVADAAAAGAKAITPTGLQQTLGTIKDELGEKFVPRYNTTLTEQDLHVLQTQGGGRQITSADDFRDRLHAFQKERSTIPVRVEKDIIKRYEGTDESFRKDVLEGMDAGAGKTPEVDAKVLEQQRLNNDLFLREADAGVMPERAFRQDYAPADYSRLRKESASARTHPNSVLNARNRHARRRKDGDMTIGEHIARGAEPDVALAQLTREIEGGRAALTGEFVQDTVKRFGMHVDQAPADWITLKKLPTETPLELLTTDIAFPAYIAKEMDRIRMPPAAKTKLGELYDKALTVWRTQATVLRPGFHSTNLQGNIFNGAFLAGALHPGRFIEAATWDSVKTNAAQKIGKYTAQEVDQFMERFGVGGAGHSFTSELMEEGADKVLLAKLEGKAGLPKNPLTTINPVEMGRRAVRLGKSVGGSLEDFSKRALFFDRLHKGDTLQDAAKYVDKFLLDYADLTDFEKTVMRRVFPFYTWMRKNIPLQAEQLVKQPHKYAAIEKTRDAIQSETEERGTLTPEGERPSWLQTGHAIQLPTDKGDPKKFYSPYLPYQDLNKLPVPGGSDPLRSCVRSSAR